MAIFIVVQVCSSSLGPKSHRVFSYILTALQVVLVAFHVMCLLFHLNQKYEHRITYYNISHVMTLENLMFRTIFLSTMQYVEFLIVCN